LVLECGIKASMNKSQCYLIYGLDTYRSTRALKAIQNRFLAKQNSMTDLVVYDMEETKLETVKQTLLTVPFFVSHRLFVLKNTFSCPKATLDALLTLLAQLSSSTVVVFYEPGTCDKRLGLYQWLIKNASVQEYAPPTGSELNNWIQTVARTHAVEIDSQAIAFFTQYFGQNTWLLALELGKVASYCLSCGRKMITAMDCEAMCLAQSEESLFKLTDALRDRGLNVAIRLYRQFVTVHDPMYMAATLASQIRTLAKVVLCLKMGLTAPPLIAQKTKLNPYVVKLALPLAKKLANRSLKLAYANLIEFDASVKEGRVPGDLAVLLLIINLHGNLKEVRN
jgi:DNA polymerase III subunit delta